MWSDVGWEGTCSGEIPAALWEQSHSLRPWLVRSGVVGPAEHLQVIEDAHLDAATVVACVDNAPTMVACDDNAPWRCPLMSLLLPSCTPCGGTRGHD